MKIKVNNEHRTLMLSHTEFGTILENGVTILDFEFPKDLESYTIKNLVITNFFGSHVLPLINNQVKLTKKETCESVAEMQLVLKDSNGKEWSSQPYVVNFYRRIDNNGQNIVIKGEELILDKVYANDREYSPSNGNNAFTKVIQKALESKPLIIHENGQYGGEDSTDPDAEAVYYTDIQVDVKPYLVDLTVTPKTEETTYYPADSGYADPDGIKTVTVKAVTAEIDPNIKSENILTGVTILGITGSATTGDSDAEEEFDYLLNGLENIFATEVSA